MRIAVFSTKKYDRLYLDQANGETKHEITYFEPRLSEETASLADGFDGVCVFVNDQINGQVIECIGSYGVKIVALRCAGFNNVNLRAAKDAGITVVRVPAYSPHAVAEHALGLILTLNRKFHRAYNRVREGNFSLEGLLGFDLNARTVGVVGTGKIGEIFAGLMRGLGVRVLAYDIRENPTCIEAGVVYVDLDTLFAECDILSMHCPLIPATHHMINDEAIEKMRDGVMLINTSRGGLLDTPAVIRGLKSRKIGYLGLDVYEEEEELFFEDLSGSVLQDDVFARLLTFPNVVITGHQAFFTEEAMANIAGTTIQNITEFQQSGQCANEVVWKE
jgi:D-lactate dehydrogenase